MLASLVDSGTMRCAFDSNLSFFEMRDCRVFKDFDRKMSVASLLAIFWGCARLSRSRIHRSGSRAASGAVCDFNNVSNVSTTRTIILLAMVQLQAPVVR